MDFIAPLTDKLQSMWVSTIRLIPELVLALAALLLTWLAVTVAIRLLRSALSRSRLRQSLQEVFVTLMRVGLWTAGILIALTLIFPSLTPAKLLTVLGLGSVAVGLAFKDIFENFFAGVLIMFRHPMRIGDVIQCGDIEGAVEKILMRESYIRRLDGQLVIVPNTFLFKNPVYIRTDQPQRRFEIIVGVAYGEDVRTAREVIEKAVASVGLIESDRPVEVFAREFGSSSIDFTVRWWSGCHPIDLHRSRDAVVAAVKHGLDNAGIEIPFPYRTLTFKEPLEVTGH